MSLFETLGFVYVVFSSVAFTIALFWLAWTGYCKIRADQELGAQQAMEDWQHGCFERRRAVAIANDLREEVER